MPPVVVVCKNCLSALLVYSGLLGQGQLKQTELAVESGVVQQVVRRCPLLQLLAIDTLLDCECVVLNEHPHCICII